MTVDNLHAALDSERPFKSQMADGHACQVPHRDFLACTRKQTEVMVALDNGRTQMLPLVTMTGITCAPEAGSQNDA